MCNKALDFDITRGNVAGMVKSAAEIIDAKGGPAVFAAAIAYEPGAVRMMKHRNYFPRTAWPEIMTAFPDLTLEVLKAVEGTKGAAGKAAAGAKAA